MRSLLDFWLLGALLLDHAQARPGTTFYARGLNSSDVSHASPVSSTTGASSSPGHANATNTAPTNCGHVWISWLNSSMSYMPTWTTYATTYIYYNMTAATTTACDGHPRIVGGNDALKTIATGTNTTITSAPVNFTVPTPTCRLAPSECTGRLASYSLCSGGPVTSSSDCGVCSIWGGTVQLNYFPITANATRNLCQDGGGGLATLCPLGPTGTPYSVANPYGMTPCNYITDNVTSTRDSGPYVVSEGKTFYQNRVYISLDTVYASVSPSQAHILQYDRILTRLPNSCGYVGKQYAGTTLTLASTDVYSVHGYHHEFEDVGYRFNFADLSNVPSGQYYANCGGGQDPICVYSGTDYRYGTDFINGRSDIDFGVGYAVGDGHTETGYQWIWDGAYSPTLLVPMQIRTLDPAWSTCSLNLVGLYDPPHPITQALTTVMPTTPTVPKTSEAAPAASPTSAGPTATSDPTTSGTRQDDPDYTSTSYAFDPLPTASSPTSTKQPAEPEASDSVSTPPESNAQEDGPSDPSTDEIEPTTSPQPTTPSNPAPTSSNSDDEADPASLPTADQDDPRTTLQHTPASDPTNAPQDPSPSPDENNAPPAIPTGITNTPLEDDDQPNSANTQPKPEMSTNAPPNGDSSSGANTQPDQATTTQAIGGIIASILGAEPEPTREAPTTTTNALSVLQSAAETFDGEGLGATSNPTPADVGQPEPTSAPTPEHSAPQVVGTTAPAAPLPITLSDEQQTHTLQPVPGSEGVYTIATPDPEDTAPDAQATGNAHPAPLPTQPMILTDGGHTRTVRPIPASSGLYTVVGPSDADVLTSQPATDDTQPASEQASDSMPAIFTGPATFVAGGETHTIKPVQSSSGIFVVDGSRTLTQVAPSSGGTASVSVEPSHSGTAPGSASPSESTIASASESLPPVVTVGSGQPSESVSEAGVTTVVPPESGATGLQGSKLWAVLGMVVVGMLVMFI